MFRRPTMYVSLTLALFVMAGLQAVWSLGLALTYKTIHSAMAINPGQLRIDPRGRLLIEHYVDGEVRHRTTDGRPVEVPEFAYWLSGASLAAPLSERERESRLSWNERISRILVPRLPTESWHLVHSPTIDGTGYFVGYNDLTNLPTGYLGRAGFRTVEPPAEQWFSIVGPQTQRGIWYPITLQKASGSPAFSEQVGRQGVAYLVADGKVWRIDLNNRTAAALYDSQDAVSVSASPVTTEPPADEVPDDWHDGPYYVLSQIGLLLRTPAEVIGIDFDGRRRTSWPIPEPLRRAGFDWYELVDGSALAGELHYDGDAYWKTFYWIDREGNITGDEEVFFEPRPPASRPYWMYSALTPQPTLASLIEAVAAPMLAVERGRQPNFSAALSQSLADGWAALLTVYSLSFVLALLAYRRQMRFALSGATGWAIFVFLFGLPGWLAYRWHRRWPVMEACGECHHAAPRDRETCASCGRVFAPPPMTGTEIFA